jgi:hypothetical protein
VTFRQALIEYIDANIVLSYPLYFGSGERADGAAHYLMKIVNDPEQPAVICEQQGEAGNAIVQFDFIAGNQAESSGAGFVSDELETLKIGVAGIIGDIGNNYSIWDNTTGGVTLIGDTDSQTWGALFESTLAWKNNGV